MFRLILAFYLLMLMSTSFSQCILTIRQTGFPTDTIFVANYEEDHQPEKINDSTFILKWNNDVPERICLFFDRKTRWWNSIWIEPDINKKEIIISTTGSNHERTIELVANSGDFDNTI